MAKRLTKKQKREQEIEALRVRLNDIYSGATGRCWNNDDDYPSAEELSRIVPAVRDVFELNDETEGYHKSYLVGPHCLGYFECIHHLAEHLHGGGVRV